MIDTYNKFPDIFKPGYVLKISEDKLRDIIINNIHPRYPNIALKKWVKLSSRLCEYENILDYLKNINSFDDLDKFIDNFSCYGQKTGGLLIRVISDSKICGFIENVKSIPIDRHDMEISYLNGIIDQTNIGDKDIKELSDTYVSVGDELNINPSNIDKYLWEVGNSFCSKKHCENCPLNYNNICEYGGKL